MHLNCFVMFVLIFILFNEYNSLSVDQYIFQNQNNFNSKKIRIVYLENSLFRKFWQPSPFPTSICDQIIPLLQRRQISFSLFAGFLLHEIVKIFTYNPESNLSLYTLLAHFAFFVLPNATKSLRYIILIVKKITAEVISPTSTQFWFLSRDCFFIVHLVSQPNHVENRISKQHKRIDVLRKEDVIKTNNSW